ncbi:MAG: hypothetical protein HY393_02825 [Candidatus Diapherotrites archaeon]|nr:hypothetical protein [Candidatus Diapherotrites archaeon]
MPFVWYEKTRSLPYSNSDYIYTEIQLETETKKVIYFTVIQLWKDEKGGIHEIKKHDCAHEKYHVHHYYEGSHSKTRVSNEPITMDLFWQAKRDILSHWRKYRMRFIRKFAPNQFL